MHQTTNTDEKFTNSTAPANHTGAEAALDAVSPALELAQLLERAAALAATMGVELDAFMKVAWRAYVDARPGLREQLEDMHLIAQLEALRQSGRMGQA